MRHHCDDARSQVFGRNPSTMQFIRRFFQEPQKMFIPTESLVLATVQSSTLEDFTDAQSIMDEESGYADFADDEIDESVDEVLKKKGTVIEGSDAKQYLFTAKPVSILLCAYCERIANPIHLFKGSGGLYDFSTCDKCVSQAQAHKYEENVAGAALLQSNFVDNLRILCECDQIVQVTKMSEHTLVCQKAQVECPFKLVGCEAKVCRNEINKHVETCPLKCSNLADMHIVQSLNKKLDAHDALIEKLENQVEKMSKRVKVLEKLDYKHESEDESGSEQESGDESDHVVDDEELADLAADTKVHRMKLDKKEE